MGDCGVITLYTVPRAFEGIFNLIQSNAIWSWQALEPRPQIILMGDDDTRRNASLFGVNYLPAPTDDEGLPIVPACIRIAEHAAQHDVCMFLNTDNVLLPTFYDALRLITNAHDQFVCIGRRTNLDIYDDVDTTSPVFWTRVLSEGTPGGNTGMDYFIYRGVSLANGMPDFRIGRDFYDNWLVRRFAQSDVPLVDVTAALTVIHANHPPKPTASKSELAANRGMADLDARWGLKDATWRVTDEGIMQCG
jgi:hypothetical protein